jgi:hypothetical protein
MALPKIEERTLYEPLISHLKKMGFDAIGETKVTTSHPDILFKVDSVFFVIEVKIGKPEIGLKAVAQASDYAKKLGTKNIVILIYPEKYRNQVVLDSKAIEQIALSRTINVGIFTDYWTQALEDTTENVFRKLKSLVLSKKVSVDFRTAVHQIEYYIRDLNSIIYQIRTEQLASEVVNKLDLFSSIGEIKNREIAKKQVINLASYLLLNQILFYHIFRERTKNPSVQELQEIDSIGQLQGYFDTITDIDYQSIYRVNILGHIPENRDVLNTLNEVIKAIKLLRLEHITHDLAGRFFHDLIPFEVRKVLAAFYTHPVAAEILANLTIDSWDRTVIDPACGSGTLLVSAYKRKMSLYKKLHGFKELANTHKDFLEKQITGIDIMPFAAHITTLNLATQDIEQQTNNVRIATKDSLSLCNLLKTKDFNKQGIKISSYTREIQQTLSNVETGKVVKNDGSVSLRGKGEEFFLKPVDVLIMNPPFSDRERMPDDMRNALKTYTVLTDICGNHVNLWGFFLALADLMLKKNGKMGTVLPINIARGKATEEIRNHLFTNYRIQYVIKSVSDVAFSEGAAFRDVLLIAEKGKPQGDYLIGFVFLKKSIREMSLEHAERVAGNIADTPVRKGSFTSEDFDVFFESYSQLTKLQDNLMPIMGASEIGSIEAFSAFLNILEMRSKKKLRKLEGFDISEGFHASPAGLSQLTFITRPAKGERLERAFMILDDEKDQSIVVRLKDTSLRFEIEKAKTLPALRTLTNMNLFCIDKKKDYFVAQKMKNFDSILALTKWKDKENFDWSLVDENVKGKKTYLAVARRFRPNSKNTHFFAFYSDDGFIVPHTFKIIKTEKDESKLQTLYLNSVLGLMNVISLREQTTEGYTDIMESDLNLFKTVDSRKLSEQELKTLNALFEKLKNVEFPSLLEQIESRFWARVELDETVLRTLGFSDVEVNNWLPRIYDALTRELRAI